MLVFVGLTSNISYTCRFGDDFMQYQQIQLMMQNHEFLF